jgi:hypothetical protein
MENMHVFYKKEIITNISLLMFRIFMIRIYSSKSPHLVARTFRKCKTIEFESHDRYVSREATKRSLENSNMPFREEKTNVLPWRQGDSYVDKDSGTTLPKEIRILVRITQRKGIDILCKDHAWFSQRSSRECVLLATCSNFPPLGTICL